jgi:p-aminobenzoyl-glutamate transporter AbgT
MICALGGFFFVVKSNAQTERSNLFVIVNLLTALIFFTIGFLAFAGLKLNFWGGAITFALYVLLSIVVIQIRK